MEAENVLQEDANNITSIRGIKNDTFKYYNQGFFYYKETGPQMYPFQYYRCILKKGKKCKGLIVKNLMTGNIDHRIAHDKHAADFSAFALAQLKLTLKDEALNARGTKSLRRIFDEICMRFKQNDFNYIHIIIFIIILKIK